VPGDPCHADCRLCPDAQHANLRFKTTCITFASRSCRALFEMGIRQDVRKGTDLPLGRYIRAAACSIDHADLWLLKTLEGPQGQGILALQGSGRFRGASR